MLKGVDAADHPSVISGERKDLMRLLRDLESAPRWQRFTHPKQSEVGRHGLLASRVDLGKAIREGVEPPAQRIPGVLYAQGIHELTGEPGCGKTLAALWMALEEVQAGRPVLYLDEENLTTVMAERLESMGADPEALSDRLVYLQRPTISLQDKESIKDLLAVVEEQEPSLVIIDSMADFLALSECNENDASEVTQWYQAVVAPIAERAAVVVLDHLTKNTNGKYARGSSAKRAESMAAWRVTKKCDFDRERVGELRFTREKDRAACFPEELSFKVGGDGSGQLLFQRSNEDAQETDKAELTDSQCLILEVLERHSEGLLYTEWFKASGKSKTTFNEARRFLEEKRLVRKDDDRYYAVFGAEGADAPNGS